METLPRAFITFQKGVITYKTFLKDSAFPLKEVSNIFPKENEKTQIRKRVFFMENVGT